ncbi:MAG: DUF6584 family protein [Vicinamibacterales bacterium]
MSPEELRARYLERVDAELAAGRAWRAKEVLRGVLSTSADPALHERYGQLLDALGDRLEAGKYLFLSGVRKKEYGEAIALFLKRKGSRFERDFVALLPAAVRRTRFGELPAAVQEDLRRRRVSPGMLPGVGRNGRLLNASTAGGAGAVAGTIVGVLLLAALGIGLVQMIAWLVAFLTPG